MNSGEAFMRLRESLGLTQRQIANVVGVTDQTVSNWERGIHLPRLTPRQMANLCKSINKTLDELADIFEPKD